MLDLLYAQAARWRRRAMERHPERRRHLARPVISVGNLSVGGTGKTPVVAALARWLLEHGERPAILSRGYRRRLEPPGVVVVSDGHRVRATLDTAGDEPLMLARAVPGAVVCVCADRHLAGVLAERALGTTVHLLDDGFQHVGLARDLDVLVTTPGEITGGRVLPAGRLRESPDAAARAHVLVLMGGTAGAAAAEGWALGVPQACGAVRAIGRPVRILAGAADETETAVALEAGAPVLAACGIGNPDRFVSDLRAAGWQIAGTMPFRDHHRFSPRDVAAMHAELGRTRAQAVLTTDKDAVRFEAAGPIPFPLYRVPLDVTFEPPDALFASVAAMLAARSGRGRAPADADPAVAEGAGR
ncbi:MAG: tetraacyldisaccharide 4'-kinase [Vicinamibacterales bacterium]